MAGKIRVKGKAKNLRKPKRQQGVAAEASFKLSVDVRRPRQQPKKKTGAGNPPKKSKAVVAGKSGDGNAGKGAVNKSKKNVRKPQPVRLARLSPVRVAVFILILGAFIAASIGPVTRNIGSTSNLRAKEKELAGEKKNTDTLDKEVKEARSLEHIEEEARSQHLAAPGETVYVVTSETSDDDVDVKMKSPQSMSEAWKRVQWFLNCSYERPKQEN